MSSLNNPAGFFDILRKGPLLGKSLDAKEVEGLTTVYSACAEANWPIAYTAYALATAYHETAATMQPVKEYGGTAYYNKKYGIEGTNPDRARKNGNTAPGDGARYCGRGYVQLTWKNNYAKAQQVIPIPGLVANPDLAMKHDNAAKIMISGMSQGWFTSKSCASFLPKTGPATLAQFKEARRIINGTDKAEKIAGEAVHFQDALIAGKWA